MVVFTATVTFAEGLLLSYDGAVHKYTGKVYSLRVNGEVVSADVPPVRLGSHTFVPAAATFQKLGGDVKWDDKQQKLFVKMNGSDMELRVDSRITRIDGKIRLLSVPSKMVNEMLMIPSNYMSQHLKLKVSHLAKDNIVSIEDPNRNNTMGRLNNVSFTAKGNISIVSIDVENYKGYNNSWPDSIKVNKIVVDLPNTSAPSSQQSNNVNGTLVKTIRYAQFEKTTARVVLDLTGQHAHRIIEKKDQVLIYIAKTGDELKDVEKEDVDAGAGVNKPGNTEINYNMTDGKAYCTINGLKLTNADIGNGKPYNESYDSTGRKFTIVLPAGVAQIADKTISVNDDYLESIQIVTTKGTKRTGITFNTKQNLIFETTIGKNGSSIEITISKSDTGTNDSKLPNRGDSDRGPELAPVNMDVKHARTESRDEISISLDSYKDYKVVRLTGPNRIMIDIPNTNLIAKGEQNLAVGTDLVKAVRYAQFNNDTARIVIDLNGQFHYQVAEQAGRLVLNIERPAYKNIVYHNNGDRVYFTLPGIRITEGGENLKKLFKDSFEDSGKKYVMTFPFTLGDLGSGRININDGLIDWVEIVRNNTTKETSIIFNAKDKFTYNTITRTNSSGAVLDTAITILRPFSKADKLVVIDPGHGGWEPGAVVGGLKEKDLNLDISLRLNALLKAKDVKTYMIREDDSYVGLYERAYIANNLNASLFLSIHNNAFTNNDAIKGSETLYYPANPNDKGFNGKRFAQIIQSELLSRLKTTDRRIIERPNLVVLKATKMPAALAEIGFMTNKEDRENLQKEEFRQNAAQALCDAIIKSLEELK